MVYQLSRNGVLAGVVLALGIVTVAWTSGSKAKSESRERASITPPAAAVLFRDVRVFDGAQVLARTSVLVVGAHVAKVGGEIAAPAGARIVDGAGKTLLPGLIDAHVHAYDDALVRALQFGVTTELDMFTSASFAAQARREQRDGAADGRADLLSASTLITAPSGHGTEYIPIDTLGPDGDPQAFVDARVAEGADYIKVIYADSMGPSHPAPTLTRAQMAAVIKAAHARSKKVIVHAGSYREALECLQAGADGLAHVLGDHPANNDLLAALRKNNAFVIATLAVREAVSGFTGGAALARDPRLAPFLLAIEKGQLATRFPTSGQPRPEMMARAKASVATLWRAGVPVLAGTDAPNPGTTHGASLHRELELLVEAGLPTSAVLAAATSLPAHLFGLADRGRIAAGARADLLLVVGDPTSDITATRSIEGVWKAGKEVTRERAPADTTKAATPVELGDGLISSFEGPDERSTIGFGWTPTSDSIRGGNSQGFIRAVAGGSRESKGSLEVRGTIGSGFAYPWAGAIFFPGRQPMEAVDVTDRKALVVWTKGDSRPIQVMLFADELGVIPATVSVAATPTWSEHVVPFSAFGGFSGRGLKALAFSGGPETGEFLFQIDEVSLK
jgi:imidazolonepropionase-like amidohydrolase